MQILISGTTLRYSHYITRVMANSKISVKLQDFVCGTELKNQGDNFENRHFHFPENISNSIQDDNNGTVHDLIMNETALCGA